MTVRIVIGLALAAVLVAGPIVPAAAQPQPASVDVTRATLPNGMQVVILRDTLAPVVQTMMNYRTGSDEAMIPGLAHAQEHMMFRGSKTLDASQFAEAEAVTGGAFNADTQNEVTQFFFEVPEQDLDIALHLERSRATGILDTQALWDQERGAITQEVLRDNSSAYYRLYARTLATMFRGTPYAVDPLGTVQSFEKITGADLKRYYDRWYHPDNAIFVIAGDVDPQATIAKVRALFGDIPAATLPPRPQTRLEPLQPATLRDNSSDPVTLAFVAYRTPGYASPDYYASVILNDVLNSPRSALYDLQASGKALATFAQSSTYGPTAVSLVGSEVPVTTTGDAAVADLKGVIAAYRKNGVPADLVAVAKQREIAGEQFSRDSISGLANEWSESLAVEGRTPDQDLAGIGRVTVADVNRVLREDFDNATATVAIATPKAAAGAGAALGGREGENNTVVPAPNTKLPAFAQDVLQRLHVPPQTVHPVEQTLPNGIKLVTVTSTITPTVVLKGEVLHNAGLEDPPGKEGVDDVLGGLFPYGTQTYDRIAYQTQLDAIAADVSAGYGFSLNCLAKDFDRGVDLLADDELHPRLPADAFAIVKEQEIGELTGFLQSPQYRAQHALADALFPAGDPARRMPTPTSVASVTLDDVKAHYAQTFRPDLTTIVVVGDVTPESARATVEHAFGDWHASGPAPDVFPPPVPANAPASTVVPATGRIQSQVTLEETLPITYRDPDYPLLQLANTVLSGGFYASLLYHDVREIHGYAYTVDSSVTAGRNRGAFSVSYGADPQNVANAQRIIVGDLTRLQKTALSDSRLQRAKALVVGDLPLHRESYDGLGDELLSFAALNRPLDTDRISAEEQLAASPDAVRAAFAKFVRPDGFVRVVVGPAAP